MTRTQLASTSLVAILVLAGCQSNPSQPAPVKPAATPATQPAPLSTDSAQQENERIKRELAAKKRKSRAYDLNKTDAYKNYIP
jgi:uncharacterized lipoprotein YajG